MKTLLFLLIFAGFLAHGAWPDTDRQELAIRNVLKEANPGWENGKSVWVASGGTYATVTSGTNLLDDKVSATWDASASAQTFRSKLVTIPKGLYGRNGLARIKTQVPSGTATHLIQVYDGTNVIASASMASTTTPAFQDVNFIFPSSGSIAIRVYAQADEPLIALDSAFIGDAINYLNVAQAQFVAAANIATTSACSLSRTNTALGAFTTDTDCPGPTIESEKIGDWLTTDANLPRFSVNDLPAGLYVIEYSAPIRNTGASQVVSIALTDGTTTSTEVMPSYGAASNDHASVTGVAYFEYTTSGNRTCEIYGRATANDIQLLNETAGQMTWIKVYRYPLTSVLVQKPDAINWRVDANISGANPSLGGSDQTSYIGIENGSLTLTQNTGSSTVYIPCSSTNPPTGTTCAAGNESVGVSFWISKSGAYLACAEFTHYAIPGAINNIISSTFQIVETASSAQTVIQEGKSRVESGVGAKVADEQFYLSKNICGTFEFSSSGQKTLRLMYEQDITGSITSNLLLADASATEGQRDIHWTVVPLNGQAQAAPIVNSVTSPSNGAEKVTRVEILANGTINSQSGSWASSGTNLSTGGVRVNVAAGTWSSSPTCTCTVTDETNPRACVVSAKSTSAVDTYTYFTTTGAEAASIRSIICMGPR